VIAYRGAGKSTGRLVGRLVGDAPNGAACSIAEECNSLTCIDSICCTSMDGGGCDGAYARVPCEKGVGVCTKARHTPEEFLPDGGWALCGPADYGPDYEASESRVDGRDNDCDGLLDYLDFDLSPIGCELAKGVCAGAVHGRSQFLLDAGWRACGKEQYGSAYQPVETFCDRLDNNCDGTADEYCVERDAVREPPPPAHNNPPEGCGCGTGGLPLLALVGWSVIYARRRGLGRYTRFRSATAQSR